MEISSEKIITAALARLGNTSEEVAESLKVKGHKGYRRVGGSCPLANYLNSELGDGNGFSVGFCFTELYNSGRVLAEVTHSPQIKGFVNQFDDGMFPELEIK